MEKSSTLKLESHGKLFDGREKIVTVSELLSPAKNVRRKFSSPAHRMKCFPLFIRRAR
jgi:hypothetical protein